MNFIRALGYQIRNILFSIFKVKTIGARALVIKNSNEFLLVKHTYTVGWYTVGGAVERGETPREAIKRELVEEVGVYAEDPKLFSIYYNNSEKRDDYIAFYIVDNFTQKEVKSNEIAQSKWFQYSHLNDEVSPATKRRIDEYLKIKNVEENW
jgi:8-oxo-dGTP pyrophosphatase MutT (NUDIX family)